VIAACTEECLESITLSATQRGGRPALRTRRLRYREGGESAAVDAELLRRRPFVPAQNESAPETIKIWFGFHRLGDQHFEQQFGKCCTNKRRRKLPQIPRTRRGEPVDLKVLFSTARKKYGCRQPDELQVPISPTVNVARHSHAHVTASAIHRRRVEVPRSAVDWPRSPAARFGVCRRWLS